MSNFKVKGVPISNVITTTGGTPATGYGFTYNTTNYTNSKPLTTGYQVNKVDIANTAAAPIATYTSSTTVSVPTGAKSFRFIGRGGGGGNGGGGGGAAENSGSNSWTLGGHGGLGGNGGYVYTVIDVGSATNVEVYVGARGEGGAAGDGVKSSASVAKAKDGGVGGTGGATYCIINGNKSDVANGGLGGNGGIGGTASGNTPYSSYPRAGSGTTGADGKALSDGNWDNTGIAPYGNRNPIATNFSVGGNAYEWYGDPGTAGNTGNAGAAQIIWLYG